MLLVRVDCERLNNIVATDWFKLSER